MLNGVHDLGVTLQDELRDPEVRRVLQEALARHDRGGEPWQREFEAVDVHASHHLASRLNRLGLLDAGTRSNKSKRWLLADPELTRQALRTFVVGAPAPGPAPAVIPGDLLDVVVGLEEEKAIVLRAVYSARPVHVLLAGPPASAKSLILSELERLPGHLAFSGATASKAGIRGYLEEHPEVRYLLLDEADKLRGEDQAVLYRLLAEGILDVLLHGRHVHERREVRLFATANDVRRLQQPLLSRCIRLALAPYAAEEFRQVVLTVLVQREQADAEYAAEIAQELIPHTRDARAAVAVCRICGGDRRLVAPLVARLYRAGR